MRIVVAEQAAGRRLDAALAEAIPNASRSQLRRLLAEGAVSLERAGRRQRTKKGTRLVPGDVIVVAASWLSPRPEPQPDLPLVVVHADTHLVVVDKPAGMPCAPLALGERDTLANGLVARFPEMGAVGHAPNEPGLVHRIDNQTSGLVLAARTTRAFVALVDALTSGQLHKTYRLWCLDRDLPDAGTISAALAPAGDRVVVASDGSPRETSYRVLARVGGAAFVEAAAARAFRHQVRAHFASLGCPLVNDTRYGAPADDRLAPGRHALHAAGIAWRGDDELPELAVSAPVPSDLEALGDQSPPCPKVE